MENIQYGEFQSNPFKKKTCEDEVIRYYHAKKVQERVKSQIKENNLEQISSPNTICEVACKFGISPTDFCKFDFIEKHESKEGDLREIEEEGKLDVTSKDGKDDSSISRDFICPIFRLDCLDRGSSSSFDFHCSS